MEGKPFHYKHKRQWYRYLIASEAHKKALNSSYSNETIYRSFIVAKDDPYRSFSLFNNHVDYMNMFITVKKEESCFHEVMYKNCRIKMYFDIDISGDEIGRFIKEKDNFFDTFIDTLIKIYKNIYDIDLNIENDLIWLSSSRADKISFHLIIDNYALGNNQEASELFKLIRNETLMDTYIPWFDQGIYTTNKSLRMLGCTKHGISSSFSLYDVTYKGKEIKGFRIINRVDLAKALEKSLVTVIHHCKLLKSIVPEKKPKQFVEVEISEEDVSKIMDLMATMGQCEVDKLPYSILKIESSQIILRRLRPSYCQMCSKVHDKENPYIFLVVDDFMYKVYFNCRRNQKNLYLGIVHRTPDVIVSPEKIDYIKILDGDSPKDEYKRKIDTSRMFDV